MKTDPDPETSALTQWRHALLNDPAGRWQAHKDLAFWQGYAPGYDAGQVQIPCTIRFLKQSLAPETSLLEIGAGTGRLTLSLASAVARVTALDHSPDMLKILRGKVEQAALTNITLQLGQVEDTPLDPHDTVLCAWAIYRAPELASFLPRLIALARQQVFIVDDDGHKSPHARERRRLQGESLRGFPKASLLQQALTELGIAATRHEVTEWHTLRFPDEAAWLAYTELSAAALAGPLSEFLRREEGELIYAYPFSVSVLHITPVHSTAP